MSLSWDDLEQWRTTCVLPHSKKLIPINKAVRLYNDIMCVAKGLKPAILIDYVTMEISSVETLLKLNWTSNHDLTSLVINSDMLVIKKTMIDNPRSFTATFIDISLTLNKPCLRHLPAVQDDIIQYINTHTTNDHHTREPAMTSRDGDMNFCTLYGVVLGYPLVYWFNDPVQPITDVVQCTVIVESSRLLWQHEDDHLLYAFSYPCDLEDKAKPIVEDWFQVLQTRNESDGLSMRLKYTTMRGKQLNL